MSGPLSKAVIPAGTFVAADFRGLRQAFSNDDEILPLTLERDASYSLRRSNVMSNHKARSGVSG